MSCECESTEESGCGSKEPSGCLCGDGEGFGEMLRYTLGGYAGGLLLGAALDHFGMQLSGIGQALVRTLSGEGESILEGIFSLRKRLARAQGSLAEAYGWGKLAGMAAPWVIDAASRLAGIDVNGTQGFYIPYFYALSDQIGGNISGLMFYKRREGSWRGAFSSYLRSPVMLAGLAVILVVPAALFAGRMFGFRPETQVFTSLETIAANLCWLPPVVGMLQERRQRKRNENS